MTIMDLIETDRTTPLRETIRERASRARLAYRGHNIQLTHAGAVHLVVNSPWIDGHLVPVPRCRSGTGAGPLVGALPTSREVTCLRCIRTHPAYASLDTRTQPSLFGLDMVE